MPLHKIVFMMVVALVMVNSQYNFTKSIKISTQISSIAMSPDNSSKIAVGRVDGIVEVYDNNGTLIGQGLGVIGPKSRLFWNSDYLIQVNISDSNQSTHQIRTFNLSDNYSRVLSKKCNDGEKVVSAVVNSTHLAVNYARYLQEYLIKDLS